MTLSKKHDDDVLGATLLVCRPVPDVIFRGVR
jgi:hypothetical protein